ncbi:PLASMODESMATA CALLOSE-BINDING PROTEIN 4-like isoform X2 [Impatiens glandulifera]|uniref:PLASMODESMATA CALLOSE-BINDING PROTEIN 4-like isoform X2 n=1 Tax=Impatiens glandulifera TaxID=253017 RepID=UPI001FB18235|nr:PLASMODESMATA CALLOSE-BINDING PROTEIN 4-like isoform X2 [Impatiens glandulifera]
MFKIMGINVLTCLVLLLSMASYSRATYCVCKDGEGDLLLQKNIDYACGSGADCSPILQNGTCNNPNTIKDHCNYAVNSYYQRKLQVNGSCDFSGTAMTSLTPPTGQSASCIYPSSSSSTPSPGIIPSATPPPSTINNGSNIPSFSSPSPIGGFDNNALSALHNSNLLGSFTLTLFLSYILCLRREEWIMSS